MTANYIAIYRLPTDTPTFFEKQSNGSYWCTHGNWYGYLKGESFYFDEGCNLVAYENMDYIELTKIEYDKACKAVL